jgi:metallophosphoesterase superfamily enzyme
MVIINGDIVHNRPDCLKKLKKPIWISCLRRIYTIPGNHDFADAAVWKSVLVTKINMPLIKAK